MINFPKTEEEILKFWADQKIFKKSLEQDSPKGDFAFYDGPPFATGTPHFGNLLAGTIKDVIPRFKTMQGYQVKRKWGWDCHGLPIENIIEQKLNLKSRMDIEDIGIEKFCEACRSEVLKYADEWRKVVERTGRWVDMDNDYRTMNPDYMESIWWVFKSLWDKGLIYEGYKSMHICPRCETTLSNFEVTQNYKDIKDLSVTVKFELVDELGTYLLAWTTTPWTLPGNVVLAIKEDIKYIVAWFKDLKTNKKEKYIFANAFIEKISTLNSVKVDDIENDKLINEAETKNFNYAYEIIEELNGAELIGKRYKPLFDYYAKEEKLENKQNGWRVYGADFVTTDEGTGIVHIAPAFGEEDMNLGKEKKLPFIQHVDITGRFKPEVTDWAGELVKPKDDPQSMDKKIIEKLENENKLFNKEEITHSYPLCWRCDTPLLNYAAKSWFVKVTDIKDKLIKNNKLINWVPEHMKEGRFGKWLEQAKDWAISRNRFWGAPLPVWKCEECEEIKVIGSIDELKEQTNNLFTKIILIRHGESEKNIKDVFDAQGDDFHLTKNGQQQARQAGEMIKDEKIDKIFHSPMLRVKETAEIINKEFNLPLTPAPALTEINNGNWEDKSRFDQSIQASRAAYKALTLEEQYVAKRGETGESWKDCEDRIYNFVKKIIKDSPGQTIVLVTHQAPLVYLLKALKGLTLKETFNLFELDIIKLYAWPVSIFIDNRREKQIDLHKHYVDTLAFKCQCGGKMKRIPEVLDCWFESGAMPYGQAHYPFENKEKFEKNFPAQFIAEGQDQTRGWFYTLLVLSTALFNKPAYLNVITNGLVLAEDGKKMSKRLKNYPEPMEIMNQYGADILRFYLMNSPATRAEELRFSEKEVRELFNKVTILLWNVVSFYQLFAAENINNDLESKNILDQWLAAKTKSLVVDVTASLENYDLARATKPIVDFINELSTWYIRRSRDRFKSININEKLEAQSTLYQCLITLTKVLAPIMPFLADKIYQDLNGKKESVHLENWPRQEKISKKDKDLLEEMAIARMIVEDGLRARSESGIKVRQPLNCYYTSRTKKLNDELKQIIADELNVKDIKFGEDKLDTELTEELKNEGLLRELIRAINNLRKEMKLTINDQITLLFQTNDEPIKRIINKYQQELMIGTKCIAVKESLDEKFSSNQPNEIAINDYKLEVVLVLMDVQDLPSGKS